MPPLTLEQVLARSMRLPKPRARQAAAGTLFTPGTAAAPFHSASTSFSPGTRATGNARSEQTRSFFDLLEREEDARTAGRLRIDTAARHVPNSVDLLSFLKAARQVRDWEDALRAFAQATGLGPQLRALAAGTQGTADDAAADPTASPAQARSSDVPVVSPTPDHVAVLLDTLAVNGQWRLLLALAQYFSPALPAATLQAVTAMVQTGTAAPPALVEAVHQLADTGAHTAGTPTTAETQTAGAEEKATPGYELARLFLMHGSIPPAAVPVACYNAILSGCEAAKDWRAALRIVREMGPNPLQDWRCAEEGEGESRGAESGAAADPAPAPPSSTPPPPDVVSYATLIATLEQAGKDKIASQVLSRLPPLEKEEITASYAALIYVWSNQVYRHNRRRGK